METYVCTNREQETVMVDGEGSGHKDKQKIEHNMMKIKNTSHK